jgi:hypothetical protein
MILHFRAKGGSVSYSASPLIAVVTFRAVKAKFLASLLLVPLVFAVSAKAFDIGFELGAGFNTGGNHTSAVEDAYGVDSDGLGLFIELHAGIPLGVSENFVVKP